MNAYSILQHVKESESQEQILLILHDIDAQKVMTAWTLFADPGTVALVVDRPMTPKDKQINELLKEMWGKLDIGWDRLSSIAGLPYGTTMELFNRLRDSRLIYPDCTIPKRAMTLIRNQVNSFMFDLLPRNLPPNPPNTTTSAAAAAPAPSLTVTQPVPPKKRKRKK